MFLRVFPNLSAFPTCSVFPNSLSLSVIDMSAKLAYLIVVSNFKQGKIYQVDFLDHTLNGKATPCSVVGYYLGSDNKQIMLASWTPMSGNMSNEELVEASEYYSIVKSAVYFVKEIK